MKYGLGLGHQKELFLQIVVRKNTTILIDEQNQKKGEEKDAHPDRRSHVEHRGNL
jgi:hypothetical protein